MSELGCLLPLNLKHMIKISSVYLTSLPTTKGNVTNFIYYEYQQVEFISYNKHCTTKYGIKVFKFIPNRDPDRDHS